MYKCGAPRSEAYTYSDGAGHPDSRKSASAAVVLIHGDAVVWRSKLQTGLAASTCEAEYVATAAAVKEVLWVRTCTRVGEMRCEMLRVRLCGDNQSAVVLMQQHTPSAGGRTKHTVASYVTA